MFNYPSIQITFAALDYPLAMALSVVIGHGSIYKKWQTAAYVYTINNCADLIKIAELVNGYFRIPKILDFHNLVIYLNLKDTFLNMVCILLDTSVLSSNAWLAGFIEADGSFQVLTSFTSQQKLLGLSFELTLVQINHDGLSTHTFITAIICKC